MAAEGVLLVDNVFFGAILVYLFYTIYDLYQGRRRKGISKDYELPHLFLGWLFWYFLWQIHM